MRDDPDRHLWVVREPEQFSRMPHDALMNVIASLKDRNDRAWAKTQERLAGGRTEEATQ